MAKLKISTEQMWLFTQDYAKGFWPNERLGQAFVNKFFVDQQDPDLFYEEDNYKAYAKISAKYVNWES